jgi:hypothetical protein
MVTSTVVYRVVTSTFVESVSLSSQLSVKTIIRSRLNSLKRFQLVIPVNTMEKQDDISVITATSTRQMVRELPVQKALATLTYVLTVRCVPLGIF